MKLKNVLIVVKDIEKSRQFYKDLFGLDLVLDNGGNMILTEGLVLQDENCLLYTSRSWTEACAGICPRSGRKKDSNDRPPCGGSGDHR